MNPSVNWFRRILIGAGVVVLLSALYFIYDRGNSNKDQLAQITAVVKSPCQKSATSPACVRVQVNVARHEPRRVVCILFQRAGHPCRSHSLTDFTLTAYKSHVHRCHRHGTCFCRKHHTCHRRRHHHCVINILGIRVCTPKREVI